MSSSWRAQKGEASRRSQISMLGASFPTLQSSPCSSWNSRGTLTGNFGSSRASVWHHRGWKKMAENWSKWVRCRWYAVTSVGSLHMPEGVPGCPGTLWGPLMASSAHTEFFIVIYQGPFEGVSSHFLHLGYSSQGQLG